MLTHHGRPESPDELEERAFKPNAPASARSATLFSYHVGNLESEDIDFIRASKRAKRASDRDKKIKEDLKKRYAKKMG